MVTAPDSPEMMVGSPASGTPYMRMPLALIQSGDILGPRLPIYCGKEGFPETAE